MGKAKIRDYYKTFGEWAKNDSKKAIYVLPAIVFKNRDKRLTSDLIVMETYSFTFQFYQDLQSEPYLSLVYDCRETKIASKYITI